MPRKFKLLKVAYFMLALQGAFAILATYKDAVSLLDQLAMVLWCTWGSAIALAVFRLGSVKITSLGNMTALGAFFATSVIATGSLGWLAVTVQMSGPLGSSAIIMIVFPLGFIKIGAIGALVGLICGLVLRGSHNHRST